METILLFGSTGWIGSKLSVLLQEKYHVVPAKSRFDDFSQVIAEIRQVKPDCVFNSAGLTGRPNVDWCESHKIEVLRANTLAPTMLAEICFQEGIYYAYMGTGCIFEYDSDHPIDGLAFTESDRPNFDKSFYSYSKIMSENVIKEYPNTLILRIRMPITDTLEERSFITKITKYQKVVDIPNSMTVLSDLLPLVPQMIEKRSCGIYNFVNPGVISHNQILQLYQRYVKPDFTWKNFSLEEQAKVIDVPRSNNHLDCSKLLEEYHVPEIQESIERLMKRLGCDTNGVCFA